MFTVSRLFLVVFLITLQFIAPLVHAHASQKTPVSGIHVPGLEIYNFAKHASTVKAGNHSANAEGMMVSVTIGIKQPLADKLADNDYFLPQVSAIFKPSISAFDVGFSPPTAPLFVCQLYKSSHSPRAPPAQ
jgi:hypothetical protein